MATAAVDEETPKTVPSFTIVFFSAGEPDFAFAGAFSGTTRGGDPLFPDVEAIPQD